MFFFYYYYRSDLGVLVSLPGTLSHCVCLWPLYQLPVSFFLLALGFGSFGLVTWKIIQHFSLLNVNWIFLSSKFWLQMYIWLFCWIHETCSFKCRELTGETLSTHVRNSDNPGKLKELKTKQKMVNNSNKMILWVNLR